MNLDVFSRFSSRLSRLGIAIFVTIFSTSECVSPPKTQFIQTLPGTIPYPSSIIEVPATAEVLLPPSVATVQALNSLDMPIIPLRMVQEMLNQVDKEEAISVLRQLTGDEPICIDNDCYTIKNRITGRERLRWAEDYLYKELVNLGDSVELQDWSLDGYSDQNLIARKAGTLHPDEEV